MNDPQDLQPRGQPEVTGLGTVNGYPVLTVEPDFSSDMPMGGRVIRLGLDENLVNSGEQRISNDKVIRNFKFTYKGLNETYTRQVLDFWLERRGRLETFYIPSWKDEIPLTSVEAGINTYNIDISNSGWLTTDTDALFIVNLDTGNVQYSGFTYKIEDDICKITLKNSPIFSATNCLWGFCYKTRFAEDELSVEYVTKNIANITVSMVELPKKQYLPQPFYPEESVLGIVEIFGSYENAIQNLSAEDEMNATLSVYGTLFDDATVFTSLSEILASNLTLEGEYLDVVRGMYNFNETVPTVLSVYGVNEQNIFDYTGVEIVNTVLSVFGGYEEFTKIPIEMYESIGSSLELFGEYLEGDIPGADNLLSGIAYYYAFDDADTTTILDKVGTAHLTPGGTRAKGNTYNGTNHGLDQSPADTGNSQRPHNSVDEFAGNFTLYGRFRVNTLGFANDLAGKWHPSDTAQQSYRFHLLTSPHRIAFSIRTTDGTFTVSTNIGTTLSHRCPYLNVVAYYDKTNSKLGIRLNYTDNPTEITATGDLNFATSQEFYLNRLTSTSSRVVTYDELGAWNRLLTTNETNQLMSIVTYPFTSPYIKAKIGLAYALRFAATPHIEGFFDDTANTVTGTTNSIGTGKIGNGLVLAGTSTSDSGVLYTMTPTDNDWIRIDANQSYTIDAWVKGGSNGTDLATIFSINSTSDTNTGRPIRLEKTTDNKFTAKIIVSGSEFSVTTTNTFNPTDWFNVHMVFNASTLVLSIYVNGVLEASGTAGGLPTAIRTLSSSLYRINVGARIAGSNRINRFVGTIDEVRIYDRALSADDITEFYNSGNGTSINNT